MLLGKLDRDVEKNETRPLSTPHTRRNSKLIKDLNIRLEATKLLEENTSSKISDISQSDTFFLIYFLGQEKQKKKKQMGLHQTKSFYTEKEIINKMKRQPTEWEKVFANNTFDKGLLSKIYKELIQDNTKNIQFKKWAKDLNRRFSKEDIQVAKRHMERCSMSLIIREMQIKTTMSYHLTPVRVAIINKSTNKCWRGCGGKGTPVHCGWECRLVQPLWKTVWSVSKN